MILLITNSFDKSTHKVIKYIKLRVYRYNSQQDIFRFNESLTSLELLHAFWYRRGNVKFELLDIQNNNINKFILNEYEYFGSYILFFWKEVARYSIGCFDKETFNNKLTDLFVANRVGLITSSLHFFSKNLEKDQNYIVKPFSNNYSKFDRNNHVFIGNAVIDKKVRNQFAPSLIQEYIEKSYELRIFYLKGIFYPMAIFSQLDEQTKTDYRNYNRQKPNRNVPYLLPLEIEQKLENFMQESGLDTGSIDMIVSPKGEYVFLEVNPVGQFDWLSVNCNYYIEEKIANYLQNGTIPTPPFYRG